MNQQDTQVAALLYSWKVANTFEHVMVTRNEINSRFQVAINSADSRAFSKCIFLTSFQFNRDQLRTHSLNSNLNEAALVSDDRFLDQKPPLNPYHIVMKFCCHSVN